MYGFAASRPLRLVIVIYLSSVEVSLVFMRFYWVQRRFVNSSCELDAVVNFMSSSELIVLSLKSCLFWAVDPLLILRSFSLLCNFDVCGRYIDGILCFNY